MKIEQIKTLFKASAVKGARITPTPMKEDKWNLQFEVKQEFWTSEILHSRRGTIREFASIETVLKLLKTIGIKDAMIQID